MARTKRKRSPGGSKAKYMSSFLGNETTTLDASESPLSDYPDDLSDCSVEKAEKMATAASDLESKPPAVSKLQPSTRRTAKNAFTQPRSSKPALNRSKPNLNRVSSRQLAPPDPLPSVPREDSHPTRRSLRLKDNQHQLCTPLRAGTKQGDSMDPSGLNPRRGKRCRIDIYFSPTAKEDLSVTQSSAEPLANNQGILTRRNENCPSLIVRLFIKQDALSSILQDRVSSPQVHGPSPTVAQVDDAVEPIGNTLAGPLAVPHTREHWASFGLPTSRHQVLPDLVSQDYFIDGMQRLSQGSQEQCAQRPIELVPESSQLRAASPSSTGQRVPEKRRHVDDDLWEALDKQGRRSSTSRTVVDYFPRQKSRARPALPQHSPWNAPPREAQLFAPSRAYLGQALRPDVSQFASNQGEPNRAVPQYTPTRSYIDHSSQLNDELVVLAQQLLVDQGPVTQKPEPSASPEVWAEGRMELCETVHYFRSWHGGCYTNGGFARGFLYDKGSHPRDFVDASVVISRAGGGLGKERDTGNMKMAKEETENNQLICLRNSMKQYNPVVIIAGEENACIPSKLPHMYCVLDYFKPAQIWWEKTRGLKVLCYRFEKLNVRKPSWWQPKRTVEIVEPGSLPPPIVSCCKFCNEESQQVYLQGWMCLQPECQAFWKIRTSSGNLDEPRECLLTYDPRFLKQKTTWPNEDHEYPLISDRAGLFGHSVAGEDCSLAWWLGMVCPDCGRCIQRLGWLGWECLNPNCGFKKEPPHTLIPAVSLRDARWPLTESYTLSRDSHAALVELSVSFMHNYRINRFTVPGLDGFITHMIANKTVVEEPGGPDDMFEELQHHDIGLRRRPLGSGMIKGESYTRHFSVNYGMSYKFIAATANESFDNAARPITHSRSRLNWAARFLLAQEQGKSVEEVAEEWKEKEFNELLALGYFEQQKINYHDDGEAGLGPTIATLSLGAPGTMRIRMKARHFNGVSKGNIYNDSQPLPGCASFAERQALHPQLQTLKQSDNGAYRARLSEIPKELKLKSGGTAKDAIVLQLSHGDIVIMHSEKLQKYYEHSVEHVGKLRFALTCRYIDPLSLKGADRPKYEVLPDPGSYDGAELGVKRGDDAMAFDA